MRTSRVDYRIFTKELIEHYKKTDFKFDEIKQFATDNYYQIPGSIHQYRSSGIWYLGNIDIDNIPMPKGVSSKQQIHLEPIEDVEKEFENLTALTQLTLKGFRPSLIVTGSSGIGKTHTILEECEKLKLKTDEDFFVMKSKSTPMGLYATLFLNHDKIIIFDDLDTILEDDLSVNLLKAALDSYDKRVLSWSSKKTINVIGKSKEQKEAIWAELRESMLNDEDYDLPNQFEFKGQIIFISNLSKNSLDEALLSRSMNIDLTLTQSQKLDRIESVLPTLKGELEVKERAFEIVKNAHEEGIFQSEPNIRTVINMISIIESGQSNPENLIKYC